MAHNNNSGNVLGDAGMMALVRRCEDLAVQLNKREVENGELRRRIDTVNRDNRDLERLSNLCIDEYHVALTEHRKLLVRQGLKVKSMPALPTTWKADAKRIADSNDIPF